MIKDSKNMIPHNNNIFDEAQFDEMRELFEDDFANLLKTYIDDSHQRIVLMQKTCLDGDNAACFDSAHTLKGASATIGAIQIVKLCSELEKACRAQNVVNQGELIQRISVAIHDVEHEITQRLRG